MPDIYTRVPEAAAPILEGLMGALELRASDPQLRAMLTTHLTGAALPKGARVLEVGCGTGAITDHGEDVSAYGALALKMTSVFLEMDAGGNVAPQQLLVSELCSSTTIPALSSSGSVAGVNGSNASFAFS